MLPCTNCDQEEFSPDYEQMVKNIWNFGNECCDKLENLENNEGFEGLLSLAEKVLQEFDESVMYESNLLYIRVREFAIGACTELGLWAEAAEYGEKVWPQKMKCIPNVNYTIGFLLVELGKFYLNDHNIPEARRVFHDISSLNPFQHLLILLRIWAKNLIIDSHGFNNGTYKEMLNLLDQCDEIEMLLTSGTVTGYANNNAGVKHVFNHIKHTISKMLPRRFRIRVPTLFVSQHSNTRKQNY